MHKPIISSTLVTILLQFSSTYCLSVGTSRSPHKTQLSNPVLISLTARHIKETAAQKAADKVRLQTLDKLTHTGSEDLMVGDYAGAAQAYKQLIHIDNSDIDSKENLAYALLGMGQKTQALQVLHNAFYYKGNTLYTSGRDIRAYATYALLEDEAGNWKEAVLAYQLAGAYGQVNGEVNKTGSHGCPNIDLVFSIDTPDPTLLAAAAHAVIGNVLSAPSFQIKGSDGYDHAYDPAIAQLERAVSLAPKWSTGWLYLGLTLQRDQRYQQALYAFNQSIKDAGKNKKVVKQIEGEMVWGVRRLIDAQHQAAQTGVSTPAPTH